MRSRVVMVVVALLGLTPGPVAQADAPGCVEEFWMLGLRSTTRTICDGPVDADGGWIRTRTFYAPAYVASGWSNCYGTGYFINCVNTPAREVAEFSQRQVYPVTPATVLPDEPGHVASD